MQHGHQERYACHVDSYGQRDKRQTPSPVIQQSCPCNRIFPKSRFRDIEAPVWAVISPPCNSQLAQARLQCPVALKVGDIDSKRMLLRIEQGKGRKDRHAMLYASARTAARLVGRRPARRAAIARLAVSSARPGSCPADGGARRSRSDHTHSEAM